MCPYEISLKRADKVNATPDSEHARMALDSLIDFAIECVMELHHSAGNVRDCKGKRDLCFKI